MVNMDTFMSGVFGVCVVTNLTTEVIKMIAGERKWNWNVVSFVVAFVLAISISIGYIVTNGVAFTIQTGVFIAAFVYVSWLCAMLGYDKVKEAFTQFTSPKE